MNSKNLGMKSIISNAIILLSIITGFVFFTECTQINQPSTYRNTNSNSGVYESYKIENPRLKWKMNLNGTVHSSPALSNNTIFIGSGDENLYSINADDGKALWKFKTADAIHSTPAIDKEKVFFGSHDGHFYAVNKNTGKEIWKFKTRGEKLFSAKNLFGFESNGEIYSDYWDFYLSSPLVHEDIVYFGSGDSSIYALNKKNGEKIWEFKTEDVVHSSPALEKGILYCGSYDSKLYALNAKTGEEIWSFTGELDEKHHLASGFQASPCISEKIIIIGSRDTYVYGLDALSGKQLWKTEFKNTWMPSSAAVYGEHVVLGSSNAKKFFKLNKFTGKLIDSVYTFGNPYSSPSISGDMAYIGAFNGFLYGIDINKAEIKWSFQTDASKEATGRFINKDGEIKTELLEDLTFEKQSDVKIKMRRYFSLGAINSSPLIHNNTIYFSSADGFLYAIH